MTISKPVKYAIITVVTLGVITAGVIFVPKLIKKDGDNSSKELDYDAEIVKLLSSWGAMTQEQRNAQMANKLNVGELTRAIMLMSEYSKNGKSMSKSDKEELFRFLNRLFA